MTPIFLALLVSTTTLQATEHASGIRLPKIPMRDPAREGAKTREYFEKRWQQKKEAVQNYFAPLFPIVLIDIVEAYRSPHTGKWRTIGVRGLIHNRVYGDDKLSIEKLYVDIPIRYHSELKSFSAPGSLITQSNNVLFCEFRYKDIFSACLRLLKQSTGVHWVKDMHDSWKKGRLQEFLSGTSKCPFDLMYLNFGVPEKYFPFIDHFPLGIYFDQEVHMLTKIKTSPIRQYNGGSYSHAIDEACHEILQEHGKIPPAITKEELLIACTICNKHIAFPKENCSYLLKQHPSIRADALLCNGEDRLCRAFRALRVYLPKVAEKSVKGKSPLATNTSRKRKGSEPNLQIIIPNKKSK